VRVELCRNPGVGSELPIFRAHALLSRISELRPMPVSHTTFHADGVLARNSEASFNFINLFNHNQLLDPTLNIAAPIPQTFGELSTEGTLPRTIEFGIRVSF
jgi:hypothetical protein